MSASTIAKRATVFCENDKYCDVEFALNYDGKCEKVKGHRLIFAFASDVFERMMYGELAQGYTIDIEGVEPAAFKTLKRFIYTDEVQFKSTCHAVNVYGVAYKFNIPYLAVLAEKYLLENLSPDTVLRILELSRTFSKDDLEKRCLQIIRDNTVSVLKSDDFVLCNGNLLLSIVSEKELDIPESELFKFVEDWAKMNIEAKDDAQGKDSPLIKDVVNKIRFLAMSAEEFVKGPVISPLLNQDERLALLTNITVPGSVPLPERFCPFKVSRRVGQGSNQVAITPVVYEDGTVCVTVGLIGKFWNVKIILKEPRFLKEGRIYGSPSFQMGSHMFNFLFHLDQPDLIVFLSCKDRYQKFRLKWTFKSPSDRSIFSEGLEDMSVICKGTWRLLNKMDFRNMMDKGYMTGGILKIEIDFEYVDIEDIVL